MTRLQELIARHAGDGVTPTALPGVSVMAGPARTEPIGALAEPALAVVAQGSKRTVLGDVVYEYGAGEYLVVSVDLPVTSHVTRATAAEPFLAVGLVLRPAPIAALLLEAAAVDAPPPRPRRAPGGPACPAAPPRPRRCGWRPPPSTPPPGGPPGSRSAAPRPTSSMRSRACSACWTGRATPPCSGPPTSARSSGG